MPKYFTRQSISGGRQYLCTICALTLKPPFSWGPTFARGEANFIDTERPLGHFWWSNLFATPGEDGVKLGELEIPSRAGECNSSAVER